MQRTAPKGTLLHNGSADCVGLFVVLDGVLRVFAQSEGGKEITLYRLLERDICLFSAACILSSVQFDMQVQAETDTNFLVIPAPVYKTLMPGIPAGGELYQPADGLPVHGGDVAARSNPFQKL